ncbi:MAG: patatin-like phospholipase family protein [Candidatus Nanoarchaeia archaeon]|nr:patatin-like phospholipase family protein [Candidatus Nanoarchaeia archaeon]
MKIGLALGGGGLRGFAHLGVLKFFEEKGLKPNIISGTSIGALVGAMACKGYSSSEIFESGKKFMNIRQLIDLKIPLNGLSSKNKIKTYMGNYLSGNIEDLETRFISVATDLNSGMPEYITKGNLINAVSASISIPGLFSPEIIGKKLLVDGGMTNIVPAKILKENGAKKIISVSLLHFENSQMQEKILIDDIAKKSFYILQDSLARHDQSLADIKIEVPTGKYSIFSAANPKKIMQVGYLAAKKHEDEINKLII